MLKYNCDSNLVVKISWILTLMWLPGQNSADVWIYQKYMYSKKLLMI